MFINILLLKNNLFVRSKIKLILEISKEHLIKVFLLLMK